MEALERTGRLAPGVLETAGRDLNLLGLPLAGVEALRRGRASWTIQEDPRLSGGSSGQGNAWPGAQPEQQAEATQAEQEVPKSRSQGRSTPLGPEGPAPGRERFEAQAQQGPRE